MLSWNRRSLQFSSKSSEVMMGLAVVVTSLLTISSAVAGQTISSPDAPDEFTITIRSPNLTMYKDSISVCTSVDIPAGSRYSIVKIAPKPMPGITYHLNVNLCNEPGYRGPKSGTGDQTAIAWDCDFPAEEPHTPRLPVAPECSPDADNRRFFNYQFQGGSVDEGSLLLPDGYGIRVGDGTSFHSITGLFHFLKPEDLVNGSTLGTDIDITLVRDLEKSPLRPVDSLLLIAYGFVGANSVGTVSGSWTLDRDVDMTILLLYAHWHDMNQAAVHVVVWIERTSGVKDEILRQDPHSFSGIRDVTNSSSAHMRKGDRLVVECAFNNTKDHNLKVQRTDTCEVTAFYSADESLSVGEVVSMDAFYEECIREYLTEPQVMAINYEGRSSFHGAGDCNDW